MIKLLLYRLVPLGVAGAIFSSALSPVRPALDAFSRAAGALAGVTEGPGGSTPDFAAALHNLGAPARNPRAKHKLVELAHAVKEGQPTPQSNDSRAPTRIRPGATR